MAEKTTPAPEAQTRVTIYVPRKTASEDDNAFISVNAKSYLVPRGKSSAVPPEVAYEYERSQHALDAAERNKGKRRY